MKYYDITTDEDTVPASSAVTGTWTAGANVKRLVGTSTLALSELRRGDALFDDTNDQIRIIADVQDNTNVILEKGFTNALSGATLKLSKFGSRQISVRASGDVTIIDKYDNSTLLLDGDSFTPKAKKNGQVEQFIVDPGASGTAKVEIVEN